MGFRISLMQGVLEATVVLCLLPVLCSAQGWQTGRVTYYGAPAKVAQAYDPTRGEGSFGVLAFGSCGYTNSDGSLPYPSDQPAASADGSADFPGSCGRCYQMRCTTGTVLNNQGQPISIVNGYYEGDKWRPYLPDINPNVTDTKGRPFPGNPLQGQKQQRTECYSTDPILVRITDSCPCQQVLKEGAPGVAKGGEVRPQNWCCKATGVQHFDISYYAFEKMAHPVYGVAMVEWRPVDCDTQAPLPVSPGYIDKKTIYSGGPKPGWSWQPYSTSDSRVIVPSATTPGGSASTCLTISPGGGLQFKCRECYRAGYQPFAGASAISFYIRSNAASASPFESSTPQGSIPNLKMILRKAETNNYCKSEPTTGSLASGNGTAGWNQVSVPTSAFDCPGGGISLSDVDQFEFQNPNERNAIVCIGDITIQR